MSLESRVEGRGLLTTHDSRLTTTNLSQYDSLSFDCYGTLIDWEAGLLQAFARLLNQPVSNLDKTDLLARFARIESEIESGPYLRYREVLRNVALRIAQELRATITTAAADEFAQSIRDWQPFPDTVPALQQLAQRYRLYILSNVDDDLFASTAQKLQTNFTGIITAQQVGSYKPNPRNFERLLEVVGDPARHIHVAQSLFHDHAPAQKLGIHTIWINRYQGKEGATRPADANFDLELPDLAGLAALT